MDVEAISKWMTQEWAVIAHAPFGFFAATLAVSSLVWKAVSWQFSSRLETAKEAIALRDAQIQDYKDKLNGATPDEVRAQINQLQADLEALTPKQRKLTEQQREIIKNAASVTQVANLMISIIYPQSSLEAAIFAEDIAESFRSAGWDVYADQLWGGQRLKTRGIELAVPDLKSKSSAAQIVGEALESASVPFAWLELPGLTEQARLFVNLAD